MAYYAKRSTFSLRWQVILLSILVMVLMAGAFAWQQHDRLIRGYAQQEAITRARQAEVLTTLFADDFVRMQTLAGMLVSVGDIRRSLVRGEGPSLEGAFEALWSELHLGTSLETIHFIDARGERLATWGQGADEAIVRDLAQRSGREEVAIDRLACRDQCLHYAAIPVVEHGRFAGAVVLSAGLQDTILAFRRLANAELAVLTPQAATARPDLAAFRARLVTVSGPPALRDILLGLKPGQRSESGFLAHHAGKTHRIVELPMTLPADWDSQPRFLVIEDITRQTLAVRASLRDNLTWGLIILGLAVALLYFALLPPMRRFRRMATALPLLGEKRYDELRRALPRVSGRIQDEVDELGSLARGMADTLETLDQLTHRQLEQLRNQAEELQRERDFASSLLDTAPALIVTHTADGHIQLANAHAIQVCGRDPSELYRLGFIEGFFSPEQHAAQRALLERLRSGEILHSEGHFQRPDGSEREVVWFHSIYAGRAEGGQTHLLSVGLDVTAHKQAERRLSMLVDHDAVTGLLSRSAFQRELDAMLRSVHGQGVLFVCDIDEFRAVNEVSGHERGDAVLALFARKAMTHEPLPSLAARLGGDEFAFFYPGMSVAEAIVVARQLNQSLVGIGPALGLPKHSFTSCVGIALTQDAGRHADRLIANAETALSQARHKGEGNWHLYSPNDPYQVDKGRRVYWSDELERALTEHRLVLHYQPILKLDGRMVSHWEVLIRLRGNDGQLIMPGQFMGVAEATGLIRRLDRWVIAEATRAMRHTLHVPGLRLALNLSGRSLDDEETLETLRQSLAQHGIPGERLILEITETAALADIKSAARLMQRYRELGCSFSLDDFGVGYTSFQYLKELPVDSVKIDGSFVVGLKRNRDDQVFVKALTEAVHGFGKQVVAEFVEDGETLDMLQGYGVDFAQGYYIGRPSLRPGLLLAA